MDITGDQRLLPEIPSTVTETAAAVMAPSLSNNTAFTYDLSAPGLSYWNVDSGAGGGGGGGVMTARSDATAVGSVFNSTANNSQMFLDYNGTDYSYQQYNNFSERCQMFDLNTNMSYWNLTCDTPVDYVEPLYGYCMPFLLVITVVANSLIVLVLSKKSMATPTNFVLMGMAICDMLTVIFPAPGLWYMYTFGNHYKPLHPVSMCLAYSIFNEIMPAMCHTASIWLTLALAVQRTTESIIKK
ncbi:sex peptide receptor-like [Teleopsis dalmanni]|uniref:sex peptide receptor-like n=1 Tax=Teleopsis dalmanni TaxID=139649 RepID=UPI0018CFB412|nr:sex peptide receptor-like [Teleopsis dalmanni]